ncbi:MAG: acetylglutamate kinase [bacterium]
MDAQIKDRKDKAGVLIEALPYIKKFYGRTVVIKYGGSAMTCHDLQERFAQDIVLMKYVGIKPVIVHGGGPQIDRMLERVGIEPSFVDGLRITDEATMEIVEMVLIGKVNKDIVSLINHHGGQAVGLSGKDGALIKTRKHAASQDVDLGWVGEVEAINTRIVELLDSDDFIPVVAPIGYRNLKEGFNINADLVAAEIAAALQAEKLVYLTNTEGVKGKDGAAFSSLTIQEARQLQKDGTINQGMIPKINSCINALESGVQKAHIIDGRVSHSLLLEIFTDHGVGTEITH